MRSNRYIGLLTRMLLVVSLVFGVVTFAGTTAEAQYRQRGRVIVRPRVFVYPRTFYPRRWYSPRVYYTPTHVTEGQGYSDGLNDGKNDAKHGKGFNPQRHNDFKDARTSAYLDGYSRGYEDGYRQRVG